MLSQCSILINIDITINLETIYFLKSLKRIKSLFQKNIYYRINKTIAILHLSSQMYIFIIY
jgi:hypothetical protein